MSDGWQYQQNPQNQQSGWSQGPQHGWDQQPGIQPSAGYPMPYDTPTSLPSANLPAQPGYYSSAYGQQAPGYQSQGYGQPGYGQPQPYLQPAVMVPVIGYGVEPETGLPYSEKSKVAAGLLNIFIPIGIGRLYKGDIGIGVAQLILGLLLGWVWGLGVLWSVIDGIVMLCSRQTDAKGLPMRG